MKRIHIKEGQLLKESYEPEAGTDHPCYYDEKTDTWYEARWDCDYGFPFGFWPVDGYDSMEFSVGNPLTTHINACGKVAKQYVSSIVNEEVKNDVNTIVEKVDDIMFDIKEYGYTWNSEGEVWMNAEGDEINLWDEADNLASDLSYIGDYEWAHNIIVDAIENDGNIDEEALSANIIENVINEDDFTTRQDINSALERVGSSFDEYFESGRNEGRIWPRHELIGFYDTEQPDPQTLDYILRLLSEHHEIECTYDQMLQFHMVFEDWRNNGTVTACTVADYMQGNYGIDSYENEDGEEESVQYARQGETKFVPHLATQQDKFNFFKNFRDTRDRAVYTPRERAAGNLAAYHAMQYPYGENKEKIGKIIKEEIDKYIKKEQP